MHLAGWFCLRPTCTVCMWGGTRSSASVASSRIPSWPTRCSFIDCGADMIKGAGSSPDVKDARNFADWNEAMVERYDIDRYYAESRALVRWIEQRRMAALIKLADAQPRDRLLEVG